MSLNFKKLAWFLFIIMLIFSWIRPVFSQPDKAQVQYAIKKLKEKRLLDDLIRLTELDNRQSATRADLLVACYLVVREMDNLDIAAVKSQLKRLQTSVNRIERKPQSAGADTLDFEKELVQRLLISVEENLPNFSRIQKMEKEISELKTTLDEIKNSMKKPEDSRIAKLEKKVRYNWLISSAAVLTSVALTVLSAR
jgi:hypothetical protein